MFNHVCDEKKSEPFFQKNLLKHTILCFQSKYTFPIYCVCNTVFYFLILFKELLLYNLSALLFLQSILSFFP